MIIVQVLLYYNMLNQITHISRRPRYYFELTSPVGNIPPTLVALEARPKQSDQYRAGWEPLVFKVHCEGPPENDLGTPFLNLLAQFYKFGWETFAEWHRNGIENMEHEISQMLGDGKLTLYSGIGEVMESWTYKQMWPHSVNFGDLCYSSDPTVDLEITWRWHHFRRQPSLVRFDGLQEDQEDAYPNVCCRNGLRSAQGVRNTLLPKCYI